MPITITLALSVSSASAGEIAYTCTIQNTYELDQESKLVRSPWQKDFQGGQFSVSRTDGAIIGDTLTTALAKQTVVVSAGSNANSFKSIALFDGQVQIIEIKEFYKSSQKPFVAMSMGGAGIVTGWCK